jgi:hypothetical protein
MLLSFLLLLQEDGEAGEEEEEEDAGAGAACAEEETCMEINDSDFDSDSDDSESVLLALLVQNVATLAIYCVSLRGTQFTCFTGTKWF